MRDRVGKLIAVMIAVGIGAWFIYELFKNGTVRGRSMTPEEARRFLKEIYKKYLGDYLLARRWVREGSSCSKCEEAVRRLASKYGIDIGEFNTDSPETREALVKSIAEKLDVLPSILFYGAPGVGKSETVRDFAREIAAEYGLEFVDFEESSLESVLANRWGVFVYVDLRLTSVEPADLMGIPRNVNVMGGNVSNYVPFGWAIALHNCPGVLFLDELTNVRRPDVMSAAYQLVLDRKSGFMKFDPGVAIISAGNPPDVSAVATKLPGPLLERFDTYHIIAPTVDEWRDYMDRKYGDGWCRLIYYYLKARPEYMIPKTIPARALTQEEQFPAPRGWTRLAVKLYKIFGNRVPEVMAKLIERPCSEIMKLKEGDSGYDYEAKVMCESIASTVGMEQAEIIPYYVGIRLPNARELLMNFDKFMEWFNKEVEYRMSKVGGDRKSIELTVLWAITPILSDALEGIIEKEGAEGVMKFVDSLAKLVDFLEKYDKTLGVLLMAPICKRRDDIKFMEIKMEVYKRSPKVREHVEEYINIIRKKVG